MYALSDDFALLAIHRYYNNTPVLTCNAYAHAVLIHRHAKSRASPASMWIWKPGWKGLSSNAIERLPVDGSTSIRVPDADACAGVDSCVAGVSCLNANDAPPPTDKTVTGVSCLNANDARPGIVKCRRSVNRG
jgi:hypothetical protein